VPFSDDRVLEDARELLRLATALRDQTDGRARRDCEENIQRAEDAISAIERQYGDASVDELEAKLATDPVRLAHWAREAGLTWLRIDSAEDVVAAAQRAALSATAAGRAAQPQPCLIEVVEAEGWHLEHVQTVYVPTKVQTSVWMGADLLGGDVVEGETRYTYLFRRVDPGGIA
jgi:hypothetical protein